MTDIETTLKAATDALRSGDARGARENFGRAIAAGHGDAATLMGMAIACRATGDHESVLSVTDRLLKADPRNVRALILRGDALAARNESRSASSFYLAALRTAASAGQPPADLAPELDRVRRTCEQLAADYSSYLLDAMRRHGFDPQRSSSRFSQSLDIVLGKKKIYLQEPKYYYFPGLPQLQFYDDHAAFPWIPALEQATAAIREELLQIVNEPGAFAPYVTGDANRAAKTQAGMLDNPDWSAFYLWKNGQPVEANVARFPATVRALENVPFSVVPNRSPSVLFSLLRPGAHIPAHNGLVNTRLICHLPLIVPGRCTFRVGNDVRRWSEGKLWLFDDTIEHEAWNETDQTRIILLFDVWRPELSAEERALVMSLFEAIDAHDGRKPEWSI
jgi:aspartyl/asparaginyl beta-hydroxylase (cupin superfamily)